MSYKHAENMTETIKNNQRPSVAVVQAITEQTGLGMTDFALHEKVSPEALDELFGPEQPKDVSVRIEFSLHGYRVVVEQCDCEACIQVTEKGLGNSWSIGP